MERGTRALVRAFVVLVISWPIALVAIYLALSILVRPGLINPFLIAQIGASGASVALAIIEYLWDMRRAK